MQIKVGQILQELVESHPKLKPVLHFSIPVIFLKTMHHKCTYSLIADHFEHSNLDHGFFNTRTVVFLKYNTSDVPCDNRQQFHPCHGPFIPDLLSFSNTTRQVRSLIVDSILSCSVMVSSILNVLYSYYTIRRMCRM